MPQVSMFIISYSRYSDWDERAVLTWVAPVETRDWLLDMFFNYFSTLLFETDFLTEPLH